ncbi:hypothetical protein Tco_0839224 [Tanacetum coccineum]|uniref:Reverse transcriptase domain-containing protein n=1 Tax=Tanacetum coccineum TaxID=301880 RepID=A0ABQ5ASV0_9ASTR
MADNRTMAELLQAPTEGYEDAIVVPEIEAANFEIKHGLLTLVQNKQFFGHDKEDPHAHIHPRLFELPRPPPWQLSLDKRPLIAQASSKASPKFVTPEAKPLLLNSTSPSKQTSPIPAPAFPPYKLLSKVVLPGGGAHSIEMMMPNVRKELKICEAKPDETSIDEPPEVELKDLPPHLEYAFLEGNNKLPVIIAKDLSVGEKAALIKVLQSHKRAIAWKLSDIKGINPEFCTHKILMEEDYTPAVQHQRRVNPKIHDVIKKEVEKLLNAGLIYPISDSPWVSPVHCVPKKGGFTVVENEQNELIPTRLVTGWRVCIDYRKLNEATRKDHFPLPFMDQMLAEACGHIPRCMMAIFNTDQKTMEVFMDDFSSRYLKFSLYMPNPFGKRCLRACEDTNLALNWEKAISHGTDIQEKNKKKAKDKQIQARSGKGKVKSHQNEENTT